jgi:hypothetical protein
MGIGRTNAGAGGSSLNFTVVGGTTEPANPKENTIWVNTDQEITGWCFSAKEPNDRTVVESKSYINNSISRYGSALLIDADLQPDTTYTLSFNGAEGNKYYLNENITTLKVITVTAEKVEVTFKTNSTLSKTNSSAFNTSKNAWIILKNNIDQPNIHVFDNVQIEDYYGVLSGIVWFKTGTQSDGDFNALKKNTIRVYPQAAMQLINGEYVEKTAKTYKDGAWIEWWNGELYTPGNKYEAITGGWVCESDVAGFGEVSMKQTDAGLNVTCSSSGGRLGRVRTAKKIDLTGKNKLSLKLTVDSNFVANTLFATDVYASAINFTAEASYPFTESTEAILDISGLNGEYYVGMLFYNTGAAAKSSNVTITEVRVS